VPKRKTGYDMKKKVFLAPREKDRTVWRLWRTKKDALKNIAV